MLVRCLSGTPAAGVFINREYNKSNCGVINRKCLIVASSVVTTKHGDFVTLKEYNTLVFSLTARLDLLDRAALVNVTSKLTGGLLRINDIKTYERMFSQAFSLKYVCKRRLTLSRYIQPFQNTFQHRTSH